MEVVAMPNDTAGQASLYDRDFQDWAAEQAGLLREAEEGRKAGDPAARFRALALLDCANLAEEIEALAKRDRRELRSRLGTILEHLLKLEFSPADAPRTGWANTVRRERDEVRALLRDNPSLRGAVAELLADARPGAEERAVAELAHHGEAKDAFKAKLFGADCYEPEQVLGDDWWPDRSGGI
jgi:hypothetical protein